MVMIRFFFLKGRVMRFLLVYDKVLSEKDQVVCEVLA